MSPLPGGLPGQLLLGQAELAELLMRSLGLKGALPQFLDGRFSPEVLVADLTAPEYKYLRRETSWTAGQSVAAVAANFSIAAIGPRNPQLSRFVAVVERIIVSNNSAAALNFRYGLVSTAQASVAVATNGAPRDDRFAATGLNQSVMATGQANQVGNPVTFTATPVISLPAGGSIVVETPFVLTGGPGPTAGDQVLCAVWNAIVNQPLEVTFDWRERVPVQSELI